MNRGDVLIVDFSVYSPTEKIRPALAVQNDRDNLHTIGKLSHETIDHVDACLKAALDLH